VTCWQPRGSVPRQSLRRPQSPELTRAGCLIATTPGCALHGQIPYRHPSRGLPLIRDLRSLSRRTSGYFLASKAAAPHHPDSPHRSRGFAEDQLAGVEVPDQLAIQQIRISLDEVLEARRVPALGVDGHEVQPRAGDRLVILVLSSVKRAMWRIAATMTLDASSTR
jgi:hypothetical protein